MMRRISWVLVVLGWGVGPEAWAAVEWVPVTGVGEPRLTCVAADPRDAKVLLTSSERRLYRSGDGGLKWKKVASVRGRDAFRRIVFHDTARGAVLAVSEKTLYTSSDGGQVWKRWRKPFGEVRMLCAAYADEEGYVVKVGTDEGLYTLDLRDGAAGPVTGLPRVPVLGVAAGSDGHGVAVTPQGIYLQASGEWRLDQPLGKRVDQVEGGEDALGQFDIEEMAIAPINAFVLHQAARSRTIASTSRGVLVRGPQEGWTELGGVEALRRPRAAAAGADAAVYLAGEEGVYRWEGTAGHARDVSTGLAGARVLDLDYQVLNDTLYTATDRGLYKAVYVSVTTETPRKEAAGVTRPATPVPLPMEPAAAPISEHEVLKRFAHEPSVTAVQERAIRYAEVHPDKIAAWRRAAARKALLPSLSVGWDHDTNQTVDLDRGGTGDPDRFIIGPEESGMDWSVSVGWDLGDLIWNDDQTSIDTRSKLMVELRDDILNEVTHAYFERRRLQVEAVLLPGREVGTRLERELRIQELTARIDALTGGWFSAVLERIPQETPDHGEPDPDA